jgi:hypothetical protein
MKSFNKRSLAAVQRLVRSVLRVDEANDGSYEFATHSDMDSYREPGTKIIFVLGSGRSGTHLLGEVLASYKDVRISIEMPPVFEWSTTMALEPFSRPLLFPYLVKHYARERLRSAPLHYADKSHPALWFAEALAVVFPTAYFVGVQRNPYDTVASMMKHQGVLEWQRHWRSFSVPNAFLGISREISEVYDGMSTIQKCAIRWLAQTERLAQLSTVLRDRLYIIRYEDLVLHGPTEIARLSKFLGFQTPSKMPRIRRDSIEKWRGQLTDQMYQEIKNIVCAEPEICGQILP